MSEPKWISVKEKLPPPSSFEQYLVYVRSGGEAFGGYEYNIDLAWWGEFWKDDYHGYDWTVIMND